MVSMYYVYVLRNIEKSFLYVGSTNNLKRRVLQHKSGEVKSTKGYLPLMLETYVAVRTDHQARLLEMYLKKGAGKTFLRKRILVN